MTIASKFEKRESYEISFDHSKIVRGDDSITRSIGGDNGVKLCLLENVWRLSPLSLLFFLREIGECLYRAFDSLSLSLFLRPPPSEARSSNPLLSRAFDTFSAFQFSTHAISHLSRGVRSLPAARYIDNRSYRLELVTFRRREIPGTRVQYFRRHHVPAVFLYHLPSAFHLIEFPAP